MFDPAYESDSDFPLNRENIIQKIQKAICDGVDALPELFKCIRSMCMSFYVRFKDVEERTFYFFNCTNVKFEFKLKSNIQFKVGLELSKFYFDILDFCVKYGYIVESIISCNSSPEFDFSLSISPLNNADDEPSLRLVETSSEFFFRIDKTFLEVSKLDEESTKMCIYNVKLSSVQELSFKVRKIIVININNKLPREMHWINHFYVGLVDCYPRKNNQCLVVAGSSSGLGELLMKCFKNGVSIVTCDLSLSGEEQHREYAFNQRDVNTVVSVNFFRYLTRLIERNQPGVNEQKCMIVNTPNVTLFDVQRSRVVSKSSAVSMTLPVARGLDEEEIRICAVAPGVNIMDVPFLQRFGKPHQYVRLAQSIIENFVKRLS